MILFIYGQDTFSSHQKLVAMKDKYIDASLGDTNLSVVDFTDKDHNYIEITRMILAMPFLAKSRLVILKNMLLSKKTKTLQEQIIKLLPKVPKTTVLVFYEAGVPDKRSALFKKLVKEKKQEFKALEPYNVRQWIINEVSTHQAKIDPQAVDLHINYCGSDLWKVKNEISKLISYGETEKQKNGRTIIYQDIELLVRPKIEAKIFDFVDAFGEKNAKKAHQELAKLLEKDEAELYIFTMVVRQLRNLLIVKDILTNSKLQVSNYKQITNSKFQIAEETGLHPFVVQNTMICAKNFTIARLKEIYQKLLEFDIKIKTGEIEPRLALDLLIAEICG